MQFTTIKSIALVSALAMLVKYLERYDTEDEIVNQCKAASISYLP